MMNTEKLCELERLATRTRQLAQAVDELAEGKIAIGGIKDKSITIDGAARGSTLNVLATVLNEHMPAIVATAKARAVVQLEQSCEDLKATWKSGR